MPQFNPFQSNGDVDDWLEGRKAASGDSFDNVDVLQLARQVEKVDFITPAEPVIRPAKKTLLADHYPSISVPVREAPGSFLSALHSTITPPTRKDPLIIPGSKRRFSTRKKPAEQEIHLHPYLRLGIIFALIVIALLFTVISLSPVGNDQDQVDVPVVGGLIQWAQDEQMNMDIAARHDQTPEQGTDTVATSNAGPVLPRSQYVAIAQNMAQKYGISPVYFVNQIQLESHFNPYAQSGGAVGIAQFEPATAASMGVNPYDPNSALDGAARYMSNLQSQFGGDYAKALAAYNGGPGVVQAAVRNCGSGWMSCVSPQTQHYVNLIMS